MAATAAASRRQRASGAQKLGFQVHVQLTDVAAGRC
jgi:hypothetical protein